MSVVTKCFKGTFKEWVLAAVLVLGAAALMHCRWTSSVYANEAGPDDDTGGECQLAQ
jgi:hypothetical protein